MDAINCLTTISEVKNLPENNQLNTKSFVLDDLVPLDINQSDDVSFVAPEIQTSETLDHDDAPRKEHVLLDDNNLTAAIDAEQSITPQAHQNIPTSDNLLNSHQVEQQAPDGFDMVIIILLQGQSR